MRIATFALPLLLALPLAAAPPEGAPPRVGAYQSLPVDTPLAREAQAFIQGRFVGMVLESVQQAESQVVAGLNVRLECTVAAEDGRSEWRFVAYQSLDGVWHLWSAERL